MGVLLIVLIGIVALIVYYVVVSDFVDAGSVPAGLVATAYIFVPLVGIPLVIGMVSKAVTVDSNVKATGLALVVAAAAGATTVGILVVLLANSILRPSAPNPVATEQSRQDAWVGRGQDAVEAKLKDPDSAQFRNVYFHKGQDGIPVTCGEVNSKNSLGGYSGFQHFISAGSSELTYLQEQMRAAEFAKVWKRLCVR